MGTELGGLRGGVKRLNLTYLSVAKNIRSRIVESMLSAGTGKGGRSLVLHETKLEVGREVSKLAETSGGGNGPKEGGNR